MPAVSNSKTEFSAKVDTSLYDEFREYFPQYGATTWFISTALESFLQSVRSDPTARDRVSQAISKMLEENREGSPVLP